MAETSSLNCPLSTSPTSRRNDPTRFERGAAAMREAFGVFGLVYLKNHGVDIAGPQALLRRVRRVHRPAAEAKKPYGRADIWYQRGWTPPNTEVAVAGNGQPDFKECYFAAPYPTDEAVRARVPRDLPGQRLARGRAAVLPGRYPRARAAPSTRPASSSCAGRRWRWACRRPRSRTVRQAARTSRARSSTCRSPPRR